MAYAPARSANAELNIGLTDGKYKKPNPNRGGFVEDTTERERADLATMIYNRTYTNNETDQFGHPVHG